MIILAVHSFIVPDSQYSIYPLTWQLALIQEDPDNQKAPPQVTSSIVKTPETGVDGYTTIIMNWEKLGIQTIAQTNVSPMRNSLWNQSHIPRCWR